MNNYEDEEDEVDKLDVIIENSGCAKELEESKDCQFEHNDWRKCRDTTQKLKDCMQKEQEQRAQKLYKHQQK
jgi:hypothetical protein